MFPAPKPFNLSPISQMPQMDSTIAGWAISLTFNRVVKTIKNFQNKETTEDITFQGSFQPLGAEKLMMKPIDQRSWPWFQVHSFIQLPLVNDDVIKYEGIQYRVMERLDYKLNSYFEYHIVKDYKGAGPTVVVPDATP